MTTLAHSSDPWIPVGTLAAFAGRGLAWKDILALDSRSRFWWTHAVAEAELRGLLEWDHDAKVWRLTPDGRAHVRDVS